MEKLSGLVVGGAFSPGVTLLDCLAPAWMAAWLTANTCNPNTSPPNLQTLDLAMPILIERMSA